MELIKVLDEENISPSLNAKNKEQALQKMSYLLYKNNYINDISKFVEDIYRREEIGETGIGNYIAIPHGQSDAVIETTIAIAKLEKEIEWETLDGNGVKVILLFAVENDTEFGENHLKLLAEVAKRLAKDDVRELLSKANTKSEIVNALGKKEQEDSKWR